MQSSGGFRLVVRRGPQPNQVYELNKDIVTIGRDITNEITINDPEVSRHHCRLTRGPNGYTLEDLGSTNGTFVNGQRLTGARPLQQGDLVGLGETVTLAYETSVGSTPGPTPTPYGNAPDQRGYEAEPAPAYPQAPPPPSTARGYDQSPPSPAAGGYYQPQAPGYGQSPGMAPPPAYSYADEPEARGNRGCGLMIGCGIFLILTIMIMVVGIIVVDSPLDDTPGLSDAVNAIPLPGGSVDNTVKFIQASFSCQGDKVKDYVCPDEEANSETIANTCSNGEIQLSDESIDCKKDGSDVTCTINFAEGDSRTVTYNIRNGLVCGVVHEFALPAAPPPPGTN